MINTFLSMVISGVSERRVNPASLRLQKLDNIYIPVCVCVCIYIYIYIYIHTHTHIHKWKLAKPDHHGTFEYVRFSEYSLLWIFLETHIPLFSSKYQILLKCRFKKIHLVVSGLILELIRQPILNLFWFLMKVQFAFVLLGVDETFYRDQIPACMCEINN